MTDLTHLIRNLFAKSIALERGFIYLMFTMNGLYYKKHVVTKKIDASPEQDTEKHRPANQFSGRPLAEDTI